MAKRAVLIAATLALISASCSTAGQTAEVGPEIDPVQEPAGASAEHLEVAVEPADEGTSFALNFSVEERAPLVIVGAVIGPSISIYSEPNGSSPPVAELSNPNAVGGPLVFQLLATEVENLGQRVEVLLPLRPNGRTGWIERDELELSSNPFRIEIDIDEHHMQVLKANEPWLTTTVAIGTGDTPTPIGRFYITELLQPPTDDGPYGAFAFGLSGFSETLTEFAGGEGVIGIHGTNDPSSLGTDVSHGCVRVDNAQISALAAVLPLGTPVLIQS